MPTRRGRDTDQHPAQGIPAAGDCLFEKVCLIHGARACQTAGAITSLTGWTAVVEDWDAQPRTAWEDYSMSSEPSQSQQVVLGDEPYVGRLDDRPDACRF